MRSSQSSLTYDHTTPQRINPTTTTAVTPNLFTDVPEPLLALAAATAGVAAALSPVTVNPSWDGDVSAALVVVWLSSPGTAGPHGRYKARRAASGVGVHTQFITTTVPTSGNARGIEHLPRRLHVRVTGLKKHVGSWRHVSSAAATRQGSASGAEVVSAHHEHVGR